MAGTLTRSQMRGEVLDNLARAGTLIIPQSSTALSTRVNTWLDRAQIQIARNYDWLFKKATMSTVASQVSYEFPDTMRSIYTMRLYNGLNSNRIECVMPWDMDRIVPKLDAQTTGQPLYYIPYKQDDCFELYPVPDAVYTVIIRYSYWPTALAADASTSDFTRLDDVIIYYATSYGFMWLQEMKDANFWKNKAEDAAKEAYKAAMDRVPDWVPTAHGFSLSTYAPIGEYYNNPFVNEDP